MGKINAQKARRFCVNTTKRFFFSEAIPSQECHMNLGPILNSYSYMGIWKAAWLGNCLLV